MGRGRQRRLGQETQKGRKIKKFAKLFRTMGKFAVIISPFHTGFGVASISTTDLETNQFG